MTTRVATRERGQDDHGGVSPYLGVGVYGLRAGRATGTAEYEVRSIDKIQNSSSAFESARRRRKSARYTRCSRL